MSTVLRSGLAFALGALVTWLLAGVARRAFRRLGHVAPADPWHTEPVALSGGVPVGLAWLAALVATGVLANHAFQALAVAGLGLMAMGVLDDTRPLSSGRKLLLQAAVAIPLVLWGFGINVGGVLQPAAFVFSVLVLVACANAFNLIDNMDGVLPGLSAFTALGLGLGAFLVGDPQAGLVSVALAGVMVGFLAFNLPPATFFLGDAGSVLVGMLLGAMALRVGDAGGVASWDKVARAGAFVAVPALNAVFVMITRALSGVPIVEGQADHVNYRLVAHGMSRVQAMLAIWGLSILCTTVAVAALLLPRIGAVMLALALVGVLAYVGGFLYYGNTIDLEVRVGVVRDAARAAAGFTAIRRLVRLGAMATDAALTTAALFLVAFARYEGTLAQGTVVGAFWYLAVLVPVRLALFWFVGDLYRRSWWRASFVDFGFMAAAVFVSSFIAAVAAALTTLGGGLPWSVILLEPFVAVIGLGGARGLVRFGREVSIVGRRFQGGRSRAIVVGAGEAAALFMREMAANPLHALQVVGFVDDDGNKIGSRLAGLRIRGPLSVLPKFCLEADASVVVISTDKIATARVQELLGPVQALNRRLRLHRFRVRLSDVPLSARQVVEAAAPARPAPQPPGRARVASA